MGFKLSFFAILISIALISFVLVSDLPAKEIENLLTNSDFEDGMNGWSLGNGNIFAIDKKEKCPTGTNVAKATVDVVGANAWEPEIHSPSFALAQNKTYTWSFWAKTEDGKDKAIYSCFESNAPAWAGAAGININLTDVWTEYHSTAVWGNENRPVVVIHIALNYPPTEKNDMWIAHAKVYEGVYVEEEIQGLKPKAVTPTDRLTTAWGQIRKF